MTTYRRYAVFWTPPVGSPLARFGASWLGRDAESGAAVPHTELPGLPAPPAALTATPRRYGFHATLKPPFRLADGTDLEMLDRALGALAADVPAFDCPPLALTRIGRFCALVPSARCPALDGLAARCVRELDRFRAPARPDELARRRAAGLTARQEAHLLRWGYPYVLDDFRFHLTLTEALDEARCAAVLAALEAATAPFRAEPLRIGEICLFGEGADAALRAVRRYRLAS